MAISLRAAATTGTTTATAPTGVSNGDFLVAVAVAASSVQPGVFTWPAGWTVLGSIGGGATWLLRFEVAVWKWSTGDATSWSVTGPAANVCSCYAGVDTSGTGFIAQSIGTVSSSVASKATPSVTNTDAGSWRVCCFGTSAALVVTCNSYSPTDTERAETSGGSVPADCAFTDSTTGVATGATSVTATFSGTAAGAAGWIGLLKPLSSAAPRKSLIISSAVGRSYSY